MSRTRLSFSIKECRRSALSGSHWIIRNAPKYGIHEMLCALMHIGFCRDLNPRSSQLSALTTTARSWFTAKKIAALSALTGQESRGIHYTSYPLMIYHFRRFGIAVDAETSGKILENLRRRFDDQASKITKLDTATDYWTLACGLRLVGYNLDTKPLFRVADTLPSIGSLTDLRSAKAVEAFDYCTHALFAESLGFRRSRTGLKQSTIYSWLEDLCNKTAIERDPEMLAGYLVCAMRIGGRKGSCRMLRYTKRLVDTQHPNGCWRGSKETSRYERFHTAWRASDALHASLF